MAVGLLPDRSVVDTRSSSEIFLVVEPGRVDVRVNRTEREL